MIIDYNKFPLDSMTILLVRLRSVTVPGQSVAGDCDAGVFSPEAEPVSAVPGPLVEVVVVSRSAAGRTVGDTGAAHLGCGEAGAGGDDPVVVVVG